jgi:hypothetical protein
MQHERILVDYEYIAIALMIIAPLRNQSKNAIELGKMEGQASNAWDLGASKAACAGLKNASLVDAFLNLFISPQLAGGSMKGNMGADIGGGVFRSARSPDRLVEALEDGTFHHRLDDSRRVVSYGPMWDYISSL